jgi:hypothetical protein
MQVAGAAWLQPMSASGSSPEESRQAGRFVLRRPLLGRGTPTKLATRQISEHEVRALLERHVVIDVLKDRSRYVLLGRVAGRALIAVVADDVLDDATVLVSAYEPDAEHGWTTARIDRILRGDGEEETPS